MAESRSSEVHVFQKEEGLEGWLWRGAMCISDGLLSFECFRVAEGMTNQFQTVSWKFVQNEHADFW